MKTPEPVTVEELNTTQAIWMALAHDAPFEERQRVFKLMERIPKCYVSAAHGKGIELGVVNYQGGPLCVPIPLDQALTMAARHGGRTDLVWAGCKWQSLAGRGNA